MSKENSLKILNKNIDQSDALNDFLENYQEIINLDILKEFSIKFNGYENAYREYFAEVYEIDTSSIIFKELNEKDYICNIYNKNVNPIEYHSKEYDLEYLSYEEYEPILFDKVKIENNKEIISIGFFSKLKDYKFLTLSKNNNIWMSITPHEINTMKDSINEAFGNVLVLGLGLGYYPYMVLLKDNIESVTIIEKDPQIIEIFNKHILPFFKNKDKLKIINDDGYNYISKEQYDYCFIDIYRDEKDGLPIYLDLKEKENNKTKYSYWIEESLIAMINRYKTFIELNIELDDPIYKRIKKENN